MVDFHPLFKVLYYLLRNSANLATSVLFPIPKQVIWRERTEKVFKRDIPVWMDEEYL